MDLDTFSNLLRVVNAVGAKRMGYFTEDPQGYDREGVRNRGNEPYRDTVETQDDDGHEFDFVGSSTVKRIGPNDTLTNDPDVLEQRIPAGAEVDANGVIHL